MGPRLGGKEETDFHGSYGIFTRYRRAALPVTKMRAPLNAFSYPGASGPRDDASTRAREAFYESLSRELRCTLDEDGRFLHVEGAWHSVLGWQPKELRGWHWEELVHSADRVRVGKALKRLQATGGCARDLEMRLAAPSGGHRLVSWTMIAGSGPDWIIGLGHDRTEQRSDESRGRRTVGRLERRNQELAVRLEELEQRYAAVERFAGTAAHQLAEPLVIAESSAILVAEELGEDLDPVLRGRLDAIGRGAARARRLMDALLADARTDGRPLELAAVDVGAVINDALETLASQVEERGATVIVGPMPQIRGDAGLIGIVLENLLSNALKYGPRIGGRVEISADRRHEGWRISVAGEGMPIPADEAGRIFEPFHRASSERRIPGVGLGLAICTRLVDRMGGVLGVEPGREAGNTFWVILPAAA
jgi:PAS domain S-box-containing protein